MNLNNGLNFNLFINRICPLLRVLLLLLIARCKCDAPMKGPGEKLNALQPRGPARARSGTNPERFGAVRCSSRTDGTLSSGTPHCNEPPLRSRRKERDRSAARPLPHPGCHCSLSRICQRLFQLRLLSLLSGKAQPGLN